MFYTGTLGYFSQLLVLNQVGALQAKAQYYLSAGYGTFGYEANVDYLFGLALGISAGGIALDIPTNVVIATNTNNQQEKIDFKLQTGIISSALEHATPEQLFNTDPLNPLNGFSAVKGLQIASAQGQRIYQITQANASSIMPNINLDARSEAEIVQAVNIGKEVIAHTDPVSVPGYSGAAYIILDPLTGDGAYKIGGGQNGGWLIILGFLSIMVIALAPLLIVGFGWLALVGAVLAIGQALDFAKKIDVISNMPTQAAKDRALNQYVFLLTLEAAFGVFFAYKISKSSGVEELGYEIYDILIMIGAFSVLDKSVGVGS